MPAQLYPLVAITGPTGAGKSDLALALAAVFPAEIVNCDSLQLYRGLDIGTAKPPPEARRRVPHHMIDLLAPDEVFSAGEYAAQARKALAAIASRSRLPLVVGGTGFYLRALLEGLARVPVKDDDLRAGLAARERRRPGTLHRLLIRLDPVAAARIHPSDVQKLIRYLEIRILSRRPSSDVFAEGNRPLEGFAPLKVMLHPPRKELCLRIASRTRRMFEAGLVEEVRGLLAQGAPATAKAFESIGYKESLAVIQGSMTAAEAAGAAEIATRQYAKRQVTWFRREPVQFVINDFGERPATVASVTALIEEHLSRFPLIPPGTKNK